tara:strand:- start:140 stop:751 length:612 start_codon:yes stop_codon:yes gene_type:complete
MSGIVGQNAGRSSGVIGAVDSSIGADSITGDELADNACNSEHYTDGSIDNEHLADNAVGLAEMASGTDGAILTYDASGNPVEITGTDGQVLTSAGSGQPCAFEAVPAGAAVGNGQQWTDVTGSRAKNTNYTNSTGVAIFCSIICGTGTSGGVKLRIDSVTPSGEVYTNSTSGRNEISGIVPNGEVYHVVGSGSSDIKAWMELR